MVPNSASQPGRTDSISDDGVDGMRAIDRELADILAGIDALKRLSPAEPNAQAARVARAFSRIDEALASAVRQLYENMGDSDEL